MDFLSGIGDNYQLFVYGAIILMILRSAIKKALKTLITLVGVLTIVYFVIGQMG
ncbi:hypothetical protein AWH56_008610 [Anaerobacillus isosaccharinicus]|uniref:Uncharacterized protein n=1 Tax=Anaerobacillus isosaccharinicus TaxID=1532552 RepID=A0A7S7RD52_9BACI|nr:hypothetical protein [Anaerobacillus isosaccharinicus]MBA5583954.1 hypothetical protein [Anaerobacillus isosaccharinicus]QOY37626.1 hypothetical protein AWH56_008610 [Anaerobacillus isosaccharinicus]